MSEPTGEQPKQPNPEEVLASGLEAWAHDPSLPHPFAGYDDGQGVYDEHGLYWWHPPHVSCPAGVDFLKDFVLTDITIEEPPRAEDVDARYREILASKPPMAPPLGTEPGIVPGRKPLPIDLLYAEHGIAWAPPTYSIDPLGYPEPLNPADPAVNPVVAHREGYNPKKHINIVGDTEVDAQAALIKEDVTPAEVIDWVRAARELPTIGGQNIILKDSLSGWEPDSLEEVARAGAATRRPLPTSHEPYWHRNSPQAMGEQSDDEPGGDT